jgi:environmental stress-induced protein Ves
MGLHFPENKMKKELFTADKFKISRWKNGAGVTAEIDIQPAGADFLAADFEWRLSSASIEEENRFSQFPGYDRLLTVLSGEGLIINSQEIGPFEFFEFQGEHPIDCSLIENAVEDLGVIYKRGKYECSMQILEATSPMHLKLEDGTHFFLSLSNPATVDETELEAPNFLKLEGAGRIEVSGSEFPVHLLKVSILREALV